MILTKGVTSSLTLVSCKPKAEIRLKLTFESEFIIKKCCE